MTTNNYECAMVRNPTFRVIETEKRTKLPVKLLRECYPEASPSRSRRTSIPADKDADEDNSTRHSNPVLCVWRPIGCTPPFFCRIPPLRVLWCHGQDAVLDCSTRHTNPRTLLDKRLPTTTSPILVPYQYIKPPPPDTPLASSPPPATRTRRASRPPRPTPPAERCKAPYTPPP